MSRGELDPGLLKGDELARWYLRTPGEIETGREAMRAQRYEDFFGEEGLDRGAEGGQATDDGRWQEARIAVQPTAPQITVPSGMRVGIPTNSGIPAKGPAGGFFDSYSAVPNYAFGPAYYTDLPSPLNVVTPKVSGWFELGDGTLVRSAQEVERIYAEQQTRMQGKGEEEPPAKVRTVDRLKDDVGPSVAQIAKGEREKDTTCHPDGGWERDEGFFKLAEPSRDYQAQITQAPGLDYVVRNSGERPVKFDGCAVGEPGHPLLEAKGPGYRSLLQSAQASTFLSPILKGIAEQASRQVNAARSAPIQWHAAEAEALDAFKRAIGAVPTIQFFHTAAR